MNKGWVPRAADPRISSNPQEPNHLYKKGMFWYWQVFHSGYGMAGGRKKTRKAAVLAARLAILDLMTGV
jgi:hypothetical protein